MSVQDDPLFISLDAIHALRSERGYALRFLCQPNAQTREEWQAQLIVTDIAIEKIPGAIFSSGPALESLAPVLDQLPEKRALIASGSAKGSDITTWYSQNLIDPAIDILAHHILHDKQAVPVRASAFIYLLQWQERLSLEREMITRLSGQEWLHDEAFVGRLKQIIRERQTFERLFWGVADDAQRHACAPLKKMFTDARTPVSSEPKDKFGFFTSIIEAINTAAKKLATLLIAESAEVVPTTLGPSLDSDVEAYLDVIKALPLFRGLGAEVLREILRPARLVHHDKNSLLLTQGEMSARFYVVLDGWVKAYTSTPEGEESIVRLVGRRECVAASDLLLSVSSPVSARAVTKAKLLSLPSKLMRDAIAQHKDLAYNMLLILSRRMQKHIAHFEQFTLRSAKQRVGGFLLNLYLETGLGGPPILLPFDKSLIAAYLGIKPETFSRILQSFRDSGFVVDKHQIAPPEAHALCVYCDADCAQKCDLAGTASCPRLEAAIAQFG